MSDRTKLQHSYCSLPWFPFSGIPTRQQRNKFGYGLFQVVDDNQNPSRFIWALLTLSIPPILARKYHTVNVRELIKHSTDKQYMRVTTWFVLWNEAFGIPLLKIINDKSLQRPAETENMEEWMGDTFILFEFIKACSLGSLDNYVADDNNICSSATEFMLEPCILIQLPWKPVIFHQWLAAVLAEVLVFENESLEFQYWSIPTEILEIAKELLTLISSLKERIYFGFAILGTQVSIHPKVDSKHPQMILDSVVVPSVPILKFIASGKALKILKSLKTMAWSKEHSSHNRKVLNNSVFVASSILSKSFNKQCYSYLNWGLEFQREKFTGATQLEEMRKLLDTHSEYEVLGVPEYAESLVFLLQKVKYNHSLLMLEYQKIENGNAQQRSQERPIVIVRNQDAVNIVIKTLTDTVVKEERLPERILTRVKQLFQNSREMKNPEDLHSLTNTLTPENLFILYSQLYWQAYIDLIGYERENSVLTTVISLQIKILQKQQVVILTKLCSDLFHHPPAVPTVDLVTTPMSIKCMLSILQDVKKEQESQSQSSLWLLFPTEWMQPVNILEPMLKATIDTEVIIKTFEDRIGRLVFNIAQESFKVNARGGKQFPHWNVVQYILPCIVAAFVEETKKQNRCNSNFLKFVHGTVLFYENEYQNWRSDEKYTITSVIKSEIRYKGSKDRDLLQEMLILAGKLQHDFLNFMTVYDSAEGCRGMLPALLHWTSVAVPSDWKNLGDSNFNGIGATWVERSYSISSDLYNICLQVFNPPSPNVSAVKLNQLYSAHEIIAEITMVYLLSTLQENSGASFSLVEKQDVSRRELLSYVIGKKKLSATKMQKFIEGIKYILLIQYLYILKMYKQHARSNELRLYHKLFTKNNFIKDAVKYFRTGDFHSLENMLPILDFPKKNEEKNKIKPPRKCRNQSCTNVETLKKKFRACEKCVEQKYPDINHFCSKKCEGVWWEKEHMAEHLEFELGISQFSNLKIKK